MCAARRPGPGRSRSWRRASLGTAVPTSAQAAWMQRAISAVESNSVPSQSKTIRSKRRRRGSCAASAGRQCVEQLRRPRAAAPRARSSRRWPGGRSAGGGRAGTCGRSGGRGTASPRASALLSAKSPYFSSPTIGWPSCARWTRIWCVRPVLMVTSSSVNAAKRSRHPHQRDRAPAVVVVGVDRRARGARRRRQVLVQRARRSPSCCAGQAPIDQRRVGLAGRRGCAELRPAARPAPLRFLAISSRPEVSLSSRCTSSRNVRLRPGPAQLLDDAEADAAAAVHRHAGRLVDREQVLVLEDDRELARRRRRRRRLAVGHAHRRHAHLVAQREPRVGAGAALVDAHLAGADHPVDMGLRHALEQLDQEVVEPLARPSRRRSGRCAPARRRRRRAGRFGAGRRTPAPLAPIMRCTTLRRKCLIFQSLASQRRLAGETRRPSAQGPADQGDATPRRPRRAAVPK